MTYNRVEQGNARRLIGTFTTLAGGAIDPSVVKLIVEDPAGDTTVYTYGTDSEVVRDSLGIYHADLTLDQAGLYFYRWLSTGTYVTADENRIHVTAANALES